MLTTERLAELEYEALQQEKRDKLNARLQVWSLLVGLIGASGVVVGIQSGAVAYAVALYPLLAACVARYASHSECVLNQVKAYLLDVEEKAGHSGYEHFNVISRRRGVGGHMKALRDAIVLTDGLAVVAVVWRLASDGWHILAMLVVLAATLAMLLTCRWLNDAKAERSSKL